SPRWMSCEEENHGIHGKKTKRKKTKSQSEDSRALSSTWFPDSYFLLVLLVPKQEFGNERNERRRIIGGVFFAFLVFVLFAFFQCIPCIPWFPPAVAVAFRGRGTQYPASFGLATRRGRRTSERCTDAITARPQPPAVPAPSLHLRS